MSPIFGSISKPGYGPVLGIQGLADAVAGASVPIVALGGVSADNLAKCFTAGAAAAAVMGAVMAAADPEAATAALVQALARLARCGCFLTAGGPAYTDAATAPHREAGRGGGKMASRQPVLVTGGAGYIGSHVVAMLRAADWPVVAYDNLSTGHAWAVRDAELIVGDLADQARLEALFAERGFGAVMHFAANIWVGESVREPAQVLSQQRRQCARACSSSRRGTASRSFVLSSSAAVYGEPGVALIDETRRSHRSIPMAPRK